jgi:hypothetical protein
VNKQSRTLRSILTAGPGFLGKTQGVIVMTWQTKVVRVVFVVGVLAGLALASGANFVEFLCFWWW